MKIASRSSHEVPFTAAPVSLIDSRSIEPEARVSATPRRDVMFQLGRTGEANGSLTIHPAATASYSAESLSRISGLLGDKAMGSSLTAEQFRRLGEEKLQAFSS